MKKFYIILATAIILFCVQLYWFGIRSSNIKKQCYEENLKNKESITALDISDGRYEELVDRYYQECFIKYGL